MDNAHIDNLYIEPEKIIGLHICYADYNGIESYGVVIAFELSNVISPDGDALVYLYIEDDNNDMNIHHDMVNGRMIDYAEIRLSNEVSLD